jgi:GntR family transcriptional regulator
MHEDTVADIIDRIRKAIASGRYPGGRKLPSENELARHYDVPRIVARSACLALEEMGYVYSVRGKGRYVVERPSLVPLYLSGDESFTEKMEARGLSLETRNLGCKRVGFRESLYAELGAEPAEAVHRVRRLRVINGEPMAIHTSWVREALFPSIERDGLEIRSIFEYFRLKGYSRFSSTPSTLRLSFPSPREQTALDCARLVPLLVLESNTLDADSGVVLQFSRIVYRGDSFQYTIR